MVQVLTVAPMEMYSKDNIPMLVQEVPADEEKEDLEGISFCFWINPYRFIRCNDVLQITNGFNQNIKFSRKLSDVFSYNFEFKNLAHCNFFCLEIKILLNKCKY